MKRFMQKAFVRSSQVGVTAVFLVFLLALNVALATVLSNWPDWVNSNRSLDVFITTAGAFATDVRTSMTNWNTANAGNNNWSFTETTNRSNADVIICEKPVPGPNDGLATPYTHSTGLFGWGAGALDSVDVAIEPGLSGAYRVHTIMHELGHCMRLDHTMGTDIMDGVHNPPPTTPSATDLAEAKASDEDPPCPFATSTYVVKGEETEVALTPKPESDIQLVGVQQVAIEFSTGDDVFVDPASITWDESRVTALFLANESSDHNEVFQVTLVYADGDTSAFTGILTVTNDQAPEGMFPHAVGGNDITVEEGEPIILDGSGSFHDDPNVFFSGTWMTDAGVGLFHDYGAIELPEGQYIAALQMRDYYGQTSTDSLTITVVAATVSDGIPWFLILLVVVVALVIGWFLRRGRGKKSQSE